MVWIQIRPEWYLGNLKMCACGRKYAKRVPLCRTKADAHDKFGFWVLIGSSCNKIDWLTQTLRKPSQNKRFVCKHRAVSLSLSVSLLLRPAIKVCSLRAWSGANMHTKSYNLVRLCVRWSPHADRNTFFQMHAMGGSRGGTGGPDPPEKSQKYRVSLQYWSGSPKNHKATKPAFNGGPLSTMAFRWWADGGPILMAFRSSHYPLRIRACVWTGSIEIKLSRT